VFAAYVDGWRRVARGTRPPRLDDKRRKIVATRLRDFTVEDLIAAAGGIWRDAWSLEDWSRRISFEIALRDATHIEKFRDAQVASVSRNGRPMAIEPESGTTQRALDEFRRKAGLDA
jgi:hypothetical protein